MTLKPGSPEARQALIDRIGYAWQNSAWLDVALNHPSMAGERGESGIAYQRQEFLGDRVLSLVISEMLLDHFTDEHEGDIAKRHSALVQARALALVAKECGLDLALSLSTGEENGGGRENPSLLADACEALIAGLYRDGGMDAAENFIRSYWTNLLTAKLSPPIDPKTALQEYSQAHGLGLPEYEVASQKGPAHAPYFVIEAKLSDGRSAAGEGTSKRIATKAAAAALMQQILADEG